MYLILMLAGLLVPGEQVSGYEISPPIPVAVPEHGFRYNPAGSFQPDVRYLVISVTFNLQTICTSNN